MARINNNDGDNRAVYNETTGEIEYRLKQGEIWRSYNKKEQRRNKFYSPNVKINQNKEFAKCMLDKLEVLTKEFNKKSGAFLALNVMVLHICPEDNCIKLDNKKIRYKLKDLADEMKISRQQASTYMKQLKDLNVVQEIEMYDGMFYAINPEYYCRSSEVPERILKAFDRSLQ